MKKNTAIAFLTALFVLSGFASHAFAQDSSIENVGFPSKNAWFSKNNFLSGEEVSINTLVINDEEGTFSGMMEFYDSKELLGKTAFSVTVAQKVKVVSFSWVATSGEHDIYAKMVDTTITNAKGEKTPITVTQTTTSKTTVIVRPDENKNGISDIEELISTTSIQYPDKKVFGEGAEMVKEAIPEPVKTATRSINTTLDAFRVKEKEVVSGARVTNIAKIDDLNRREVEAKLVPKDTALSTSTPTFGVTDHIERPIRYVYWAFLVVVGEILNRSWLFYLLVIWAVWFAVRFVWRKVRGR